MSLDRSLAQTGERRVLAEDRSRVIQLVMLTRLLARRFDIDMQFAPNCGGELKITAAILQQPVIDKMPTHLVLQARAPRRWPAPGQAPQAACQSRAATAQLQSARRHRGALLQRAALRSWPAPEPTA
jgi:hypothetical protein